MGSENSKSEPRERPRPQTQPRTQPQTTGQQGNVRQGYPGYPQYPSSTQNPATHATLERTRSPYNYTNQELHGVGNKNSPSNLYPNLTENRPSTPVQRVQSAVTPVSTSNASSSSGPAGRTEARDYVFVNFDQARWTPKPSAPPAPAETAKPNVRPPRPTPPNPARSNNTSSPAASTSAYTPALNTISVSRGRAADDKYNCPTCSQHLGTTIYQCRTGHGSCKVCQQANRACGKCAAPLTNTRNIMLESLVAEHLLANNSKCPNTGCTLSFNHLDMQNHLKECPFGETDCPMGKLFGQCPIRYKVEDLIFHFDTFHKEQRSADVGKEMFIFNICMNSHKVFLVKIGPYHFLVHVKVSDVNRTVYMAVQLFGTAVSATKWTYEVHVYNKRQPRRKYQCTDSCISISTPIDDIFKESKCATLPLTYAMTFVNESSLTYKFYIKKTEGKWRERNKWKRQQNE